MGANAGFVSGTLTRGRVSVSRTHPQNYLLIIPAIRTFKQPTITPPNMSIFAKSTPNVSLANKPANIETREIAPMGKNGYTIITNHL